MMIVTARADLVCAWACRPGTIARTGPGSCEFRHLAGRNGPCDTRVMRRVFGEVLMTVGAVIILFLILAIADVRVRDQFTRRTVTQPSAEVASVMARAHRGANTIAAIAREESRTHTPLLVFSVAAAILVVFMLRT